MKCIYCLKEKNEISFTKVEHVIPQSFGVFKNNFVLNKIVCDSCNQYFGNNLEIDLARDTLEGQVRFNYKLKHSSEFKSLGKRSRLMVRIAEGFFKGAYAYREYSKEEGKVLVKPSPQVGFLKANSPQYDFFVLSQIPHKNTLTEGMYNLDDPQGIIILGCDPTTVDNILRDKGFVFKIGGIKDPPCSQNSDWLCDVEGEIDQKIFRAIAKIGFNYLAYWERPDFVIHSDFDPIRRFIRYGQKVSYLLIQADDSAILSDEIDSSRRRLGHMVTVNWAVDRNSIVAQVSLFNWFKYSVCLAINFSGERREITRGHFFNVHTQEILDMGVQKIMK